MRAALRSCSFLRLLDCWKQRRREEEEGEEEEGEEEEGEERENGRGRRKERERERGREGEREKQVEKALHSKGLYTSFPSQCTSKTQAFNSISHHIEFIFKFFDSLSCLVHFFLISTCRDVKIVQGESPEHCVEFGGHILPHFG